MSLAEIAYRIIHIGISFILISKTLVSYNCNDWTYCYISDMPYVNNKKQSDCICQKEYQNEFGGNAADNKKYTVYVPFPFLG